MVKLGPTDLNVIRVLGVEEDRGHADDAASWRIVNVTRLPSAGFDWMRSSFSR